MNNNGSPYYSGGFNPSEFNNENDHFGSHILTVFAIVAVVALVAVGIIFLAPKDEEEKYDSEPIVTKKLEMNVGDTINLVGELDDDVDPSDLEYKVSNKKIATVSETGEIEAIDDGNVVITIKSKTDKKFEKKIEINISVPEEPVTPEDPEEMVRTTPVKPVEDEPVDKGTIKFNNTDYTCEAGKSFDVMITTTGTYNDSPVTIKAYSSSDTSIAYIAEGTTSGNVTNCSDCQAFHVTCRKAGTVTLNAESSSGVKATAKVLVNNSQNKGTIKFDKTNYSCLAGESFDVMINTTGTYNGASITVKSFKSSDTNIATIETGTTGGMVTDCTNCSAAHVTCKKTGTVTLTATSSTDVTATSSVIVNEGKGSISFDKSNYTCKVGESFNVMIKTSGTNDNKPITIKQYLSSNTSFATIESGNTNGMVTDCIDCAATHVTCKKKGTVVLTAISSTGVKTTSKVTITE